LSCHFFKQAKYLKVRFQQLHRYIIILITVSTQYFGIRYSDKLKKRHWFWGNQFFFSDILICYIGKFVFQLRHNKTGNQRCYFLYNQYPLHWHLVKHASLLRKLHRLIALLYFISALDRKLWLSVGHYKKVRQKCSVSFYTS